MNMPLRSAQAVTAVAPAKPRGPLQTIAALLRNPIEGWPPEVYREPMVRVMMLRRPSFFVTHPDLIQEALVEKADSFNKDETVRRALGPALGRGILTADGPHWRWQRRLAAPVFRHDRILSLLPAMIGGGERTRDRWLERARPAGPEGASVDVSHEMMRTTFEVIVETMLSGTGMDVDAVERAITRYLATTGWPLAYTLMRAPRWMPHPGRGAMMQARDYLRRQMRDAIVERRRSGEAKNDLLGLLLAAEDPESGRMMDDEDIVDNLLTFIAAGHETTALALTWAFYLLSRHPAVEERVVAEVRALGDQGVTPGNVEHLVYTRQVVQEAMRLYPPAAVIVRVAIEDVTVGAQPVPRGTAIMVPIQAVHRHEQLWDRPDVFDPERFAPEAVKARHRYAYLPFGAGPRICIGMGFALLEATAILATLVGAVKLTPVRPEPPRPVLRITLRPEGGMPMQVTPRP